MFIITESVLMMPSPFTRAYEYQAQYQILLMLREIERFPASLLDDESHFMELRSRLQEDSHRLNSFIFVKDSPLSLI